MTTPEQEKQAFESIWDGLLTQSTARPSHLPLGFVLGGQPGAGKSQLVMRIGKDLQRNLLVINGDEYRRYHPDFEEIQALYGKDAPKYTAAFSGKMAEMLLERALTEKYNVSIEGTFRTAVVPLETLEKMRRHGYQTAVHIQTAPAEVSWQSTLERYNKMLEVGEHPRYTDKAHHDLVVDLLARNADEVFKSGRADSFRVYSRDGLIFDDKIHQGQLPGTAIDTELHRNSRLLAKLERQYNQNEHRLSDKQKLTAAAAQPIIDALRPVDQIQAKINLYSGQLSELGHYQQDTKIDTDIDIDR